jgi:hypothetical protein
MIRVMLPYHLQTLAKVGREVEIAVEGPITPGSILDALEGRYPMLGGTIRHHVTRERRPFIRFFADGRDWSLDPMDIQLPDSVASGAVPFRIVGAMAGG